MENTSEASGAVSLTFPDWIRIENIWKMLLKLPGQFPLHSRIKSLLKTYGNASGASWAVSLTFPHFLIENLRKTLLERPGQFPVHFLIKSFLKTYGKYIWSLLGSFPHISFLNPSWKHMEMLLEPAGQFPSHFLIKSLLKTYGNASGASRAVSRIFPY